MCCESIYCLADNLVIKCERLIQIGCQKSFMFCKYGVTELGDSEVNVLLCIQTLCVAELFAGVENSSSDRHIDEDSF